MGLLTCLRRSTNPEQPEQPNAPDPWLQLINRSSLVTDDELRAAAEAVTIQVREQLAPAWDVGENLVIEVIGKDAVPSDEAWWMSVHDDADVAGALGYHDVTAEGRPLAKVFARVTQAAGEPVSGVISHEATEMLVDQRINLWADDDRGRSYALETADAVQGHDYPINGVLVADFVLPSFFHAIDVTPPYDHLGVVERPFQTMPRGYQLVRSTGGIEQVRGSLADAERAAPREGSRRERRIRREQGGIWHRSVWL